MLVGFHHAAIYACIDIRICMYLLDVCLVDGAINEWLWWMAGDLVDGRGFGG
jgi:hypothetical protein